MWGVFSPENTLPGLVWIVLLLVRAGLSSSRWPTALLLVWAVINLLGAVLTVLPLPVLPFTPEQTPRHYAFHLVYAATQLPAVHFVRADLARR